MVSRPQISQASGFNLMMDPNEPLHITFADGKKVRIEVVPDGIRVPLQNGVKINVETRKDHSIIRFTAG